MALTCPVWAQSDTPPPDGPPPGGHHGMGMLTQDERTELKAAHEKADQDNPDLAAQGKQLREQFRDFEKKMHEAMIKADPKVEPILAKLEAGHHHGPPPDGGGDDNK